MSKNAEQIQPDSDIVKPESEQSETPSSTEGLGAADEDALSIEGATDGDGRAARRRRARTLIVCICALVLLAGAAVTFTVLAAKESAKTDDREAALSAAKERLPVLLSYSVRTLQDDLSRSKEQTTGEFKKDYAELLDDAVTPAAVQKKISTKAELTGAGVVSSSDSEVIVLVFLTQTTTAPGVAPSINTSRVEVVMRKAGDSWKIAGLTPR